MAQSTITSYFSNRKRPAHDDFKIKSKVLVLDQAAVPLGYDANSTDILQPKQVTRKVIVAKNKPSNTSAPDHKPTTRISSAKVNKNAKQPNLTDFFQKPESEPKPEETPKESEASTKPTVPFEIRGPLSPVKRRIESIPDSSKPKEPEVPPRKEPKKKDSAVERAREELSLGEIKSRLNRSSRVAELKERIGRIERGYKQISELNRDAGNPSTPLPLDASPRLNRFHTIEVEVPVSPTKSPLTSPRKLLTSPRHKQELSLGEIKTRLSRSSRVAELKERIARINRGNKELAERDAEKTSTPLPPDASPRLNRFHATEVEVPLTPTKSPLTSPQKLLSSPRHTVGSLSPTKAPAYQRFAELATRTPTTPESKLPLPTSYRMLAELFRCVDIVVSMLCNRRETVTFKKLKPAVQEMRRRTLSERHLAQMVTVYPDAFELSQAKVKNFGSLAKEKYELVVTPLRKTDNGRIPAEPGTMTPAVLAERQQDFYKSLLEIARGHHDEFLRSLDPPILLEKERVFSWHSEFHENLDKVPEVTPAELPVAPGQEKISSAKDVLAHARHLFTANPRMAKALETVAASHEGNTVKVEVVDANSNPPPPVAPPTKPNITAALKGLPKALIEKVRARQAAKALEAMTRSVAEDKEVAQYSRLPEIARILRNCYVVEKKGVMPLDTVVEKVINSYRNTLSRRELEEHLKLLAREVPGWLTFDHLRNTDFVRLSKGADMNKVMKRLESLAMQKTGVNL